MIHEILIYSASLFAGFVLGAIFFGGLWWTIRKGFLSTRPALWFFVSMWLRTAIVLIGFYFVGAADWQRMLLCLMGFLIARLMIKRMTEEPEKINPSRLKEVNHAH